MAIMRTDFKHISTEEMERDLLWWHWDELPPTAAQGRSTRQTSHPLIDLFVSVVVAAAAAAAAIEPSFPEVPAPMEHHWWHFLRHSHSPRSVEEVELQPATEQLVHY